MWGSGGAQVGLDIHLGGVPKMLGCIAEWCGPPKTSSPLSSVFSSPLLLSFSSVSPFAEVVRLPPHPNQHSFSLVSSLSSLPSARRNPKSTYQPWRSCMSVSADLELRGARAGPRCCGASRSSSRPTTPSCSGRPPVKTPPFLVLPPPSCQSRTPLLAVLQRLQGLQGLRRRPVEVRLHSLRGGQHASGPA